MGLRKKVRLNSKAVISLTSHRDKWTSYERPHPFQPPYNYFDGLRAFRSSKGCVRKHDFASISSPREHSKIVVSYIPCWGTEGQKSTGIVLRRLKGRGSFIQNSFVMVWGQGKHGFWVETYFLIEPHFLRKTVKPRFPPPNQSWISQTDLSIPKHSLEDIKT